MGRLKHTFKTDILFKLLFVKHPQLLRRLIAHLLKIPFESISQFEIRNPEMPPDGIGQKFCRLDINMVVDGQNVNLEVQVENEGDYPERALFHWARIYSSSLLVGERYTSLPRTIIISIIGFTLFHSCTEFHSEFQPLEVTRYKPLTDKLTLHFFELPKLPDEIDKSDLLLLWLALFKAETEEELNKIDGLGVPELSEAVNAYHTVTTSPEYQEYERLMVKASHDEAQALYNAERRGAEVEREKWLGVAEESKKKDKELESKDKELEIKDKEIGSKDKELESKDKENEALRAEIEQLRNG